VQKGTVMKYFISRMTIAAILIFSYNLNFTIQQDIYIENYYGSIIKFKRGAANSTAPEVRVANQERVFVGDILSTPALSIRTIGTGSHYVSYFTELTTQLEQIFNERSANAGKDAIIIIKPSRSYQNWDIEVHWQTFNRTTIAWTNAEEKLDDIMHGLFGQNYAEKARAINNHDYTNSNKQGLPDLKKGLLKSIGETLAPYERYRGRNAQQGWVAPDLLTDEDLQGQIDMLYRSLELRKRKGL
jgi:hypothetical protein